MKRASFCRYYGDYVDLFAAIVSAAAAVHKQVEHDNVAAVASSVASAASAAAVVVASAAAAAHQQNEPDDVVAAAITVVEHDCILPSRIFLSLEEWAVRAPENRFYRGEQPVFQDLFLLRILISLVFIGYPTL